MRCLMVGLGSNLGEILHTHLLFVHIQRKGSYLLSRGLVASYSNYT